MVNELRIYFEGDNRLKPGFHAFIKEIVEAARKKRCRFQLVEAKGTPFQDFDDAVKTHPTPGTYFCWIAMLRSKSHSPIFAAVRE
jgi:hypothetical protein